MLPLVFKGKKTGRKHRLMSDALAASNFLTSYSQVFKVYAFYMFGLLSFWTPPAPSPVFNIPLLTDWHLSAKKPQQIGMKGGRAKELAFGLFMGFLKWLTPRPKLFLWLQVKAA
jgi:hypothetical protein